MSISNVSGNSNLYNILYAASSSNTADMVNNTSDTSGLNGIISVDSSAQETVESSEIDTDSQSSSVGTFNPFDVNDISSALKAISTKTDINSIVNLNEYTGEVYKQSQLSEANEIAAAENHINSSGGVINLDESVKIAMEEQTADLDSSAGYAGITDMSGIITNTYNNYKKQTEKDAQNSIDVEV